VRRGELIARVESNESLQVYPISAPMSGVIAERGTNVGDVVGADPMFVIVNPGATILEFHVFPRDLEVVRAGQRVAIQTLDGKPVATGTISGFVTNAEAASGTAVARVSLPNPAGVWRPGMSLKGLVTVSGRQVPLAVRTRALQRFRDFTVVFAAYGTTYEVRMLELGQRTPEWTEVLSGLDPGTPYVTDGAFLVRADVEKSGASHDH
jgi:cobalt-zinc-cadmium efflux system membrane fusion protein